MEFDQNTEFKNLKHNIINAIKQSCYKIDVRVYNIANQVAYIPTYHDITGAETLQDLSKINDKTIKEAIAVDCQVSVVVQGLLIGSYRSCPFNRSYAYQPLHLLIYGILEPIYKYNGDVLQAMDGIMSGTLVIAKEYKINTDEFLKVAREVIVTTAQSLNTEFGEDIKESLSNSEVPPE